MDVSRRGIIGAAAFGIGPIAAIDSSPAMAQARPTPLGTFGLEASTLGLRPGSADDQSKVLQAALIEAAKRNAPLVIAPGRYRVSGVVLPDGARLIGVPGATLLTAAAPGPLLTGKRLQRAALTGLSFDGLSLTAPEREGLVQLEDVKQIEIDDCAFVNGGAVGTMLLRSGGRITGNSFRGIRNFGLWSIDSTGLAIEGNTLEDIGNNGIVLWRTRSGDDGSLIRGNRITRVRADNGGDGPNGNGIVTFRAGGVIIEGNLIRDCALTFIRNNSGANVQMIGNNCARSGEVGVYSEFAFESSVIMGNIIEDVAHGISITNLDHGGRLAVCANNIVRRARRRTTVGFKGLIGGRGVLVEAECAVTGNVFEDCELVGMQIGWSWAMRNLIATGNVIRNCGIGAQVSVVQQQGTTDKRNALIASNLFSGCKGGAIIGMEWDKPVTGDLTKAADTRAAGIRIEGNQVG
jgi:uncharacterized secreted repeat protein (TIGR03808 family)